jgi:transcriptional regulator with XRE-family HTH domain
MDLGARISAWLRIRGMTQKAWRSWSGKSPGAVTAWVKGGASPTQKNLQAVVDALGVTMAEFYGALPRSKRTRLAA